VSLLRHPCGWPGCGVRVQRSDLGTDSGRCFKHGAWVACRAHRRGVPGYGEAYDAPHCPACRWATPKVQDKLEANRRNAAEQARERESLSKYEAVFRAQGYGQAAAEAMARKQFREEQPAIREWYPSLIEQERAAAERQRRIAAGELGRCPRCGKYAPIAQGVILAHDRGPYDQYIACEAEGTVFGGV
jgi:hypothetical protein